MHESLNRLRDPDLDLTSVLCQLILDIRRILIHPDLQNHVKLSAIQTAVDELAPPPPVPDPSTSRRPPLAGTRLPGTVVPYGGRRATGHGPPPGLPGATVT
jgi:hypothetical protein